MKLPLLPLAFLLGCSQTVLPSAEGVDAGEDSGALCAPFPAYGECSTGDGGLGAVMKCHYSFGEPVPGPLFAPVDLGGCSAIFVVLGSYDVGYCCP